MWKQGMSTYLVEDHKSAATFFKSSGVVSQACPFSRQRRDQDEFERTAEQKELSNPLSPLYKEGDGGKVECSNQFTISCVLYMVMAQHIAIFLRRITFFS